MLAEKGETVKIASKKDLYPDRPKQLPGMWMDSVSTDEVQLSAGKRFIKGLREYPSRDGFTYGL